MCGARAVPKARASGAPTGARSIARPDSPDRMLTPESLPEVQRALADAGVDGWLLYDFRGLNPIAGGLMRLEGMTTRRAFAYVPAAGTPVALTHVIEQG